MGEPVRRRRVLALLAALPLALAGCHPSGKPAKQAASGGSRAGAKPTGSGAAATGETAPKTLSVAGFQAAIPDVDPSGLDGHQRAELVSLAKDVLCACGQSPTSLAGALREKDPCLLARRMIGLAGTMVQAGLSSLEATNALEQYYGGFAPPNRRLIMVDPKTCSGSTNAPVTLVEFADFQCPHCREAFPLIHKVVEHYKGKVRWCYLNFPLPQHPEARAAAEVAEMAKKHGRFFEMAKLLFAHQDELSTKTLVALGKKVGLKPKAVTEALARHTYMPIVKAQFVEARRLGLNGTPTLFINGRKLTLPIQLLPWAIDDELLFKSHGNSWNG